MAENKLTELQDLLERLEHAVGRGSGQHLEAGPSNASNLRRAMEVLAVEHVFQPGDLVQWKPGMKNKSRPADGEPIVVVEVRDEPLLDNEHSSGSPYFREPLTLLGGFRDDDGDFLILHYDKRRFEPYEGA